MVGPTHTPWERVLLVTALAIGVFVTQFYIPVGVASSVMYLAVVLLTLSSPSIRFTYFAAALVSGLMLLAYFLRGHLWFMEDVPAMLNVVLALFGVWATTILCVQAKHVRHELIRANLMLDERVRERTSTLTVVVEELREE